MEHKRLGKIVCEQRDKKLLFIKKIRTNPLNAHRSRLSSGGKGI